MIQIIADHLRRTFPKLKKWEWDNESTKARRITATNPDNNTQITLIQSKFTPTKIFLRTNAETEEMHDIDLNDPQSIPQIEQIIQQYL